LLDLLTPTQQGQVGGLLEGRSPASAGNGPAFGSPAAEKPDSGAGSRREDREYLGQEKDEPVAWPEIAGGVQPGDVLLIDGIRHRIDREGRLWLPGEAPLTVMGWSLSEVRATISTLPFASGRPLGLRILPRSERLSGLGVQPFGYDILRSGNATLPDPRAPVAKDYVVGPGDTFLLQLFGKESAEYNLAVTRDGTLLIPRFGPLQVAGLSYDEVHKLIRSRIRSQSIGVEVGVTMGTLRSIQVFVLGDVEKPGLYGLSAMSTPIHALYAAGGVRPNGSLRRVEVKRNGKSIGVVDLYDFLLSGNSRAHLRLESGDVVLVPPVEGLVAVAGMVRRAAIYELKGGETAADMLTLAGGLSAEGNEAAIRLQRLEPVRGQSVRDLGSAELVLPVQDGDVLRVYPKFGGVLHTIRIGGHVVEPGEYPWSTGMRLTDLVQDMGRLLPGADPDFILVARMEQPGTAPAYYQTSLREALLHPESDANLALHEQDRILVFSVDDDRATLLRPEVDQLSRTAVAGKIPDRTVAIDGEVHHVGRYPLTSGMRLMDLLAAAGSTTGRAFPHQVLITRFSLSGNGEQREASHITVDLEKARAGSAGDNLQLQPGDRVMVRSVPSWQGGAVMLSGEVKFPGRYVIGEGETVGDLVKRAGGLTEHAYLDGVVFTREEVRRQATREWGRAIEDLEKEIAWLQGDTSPIIDEAQRHRSVAAGNQLLQSMREADLPGRVAIQLRSRRDGNVEVVGGQVTLAAGDRLHIPRQPDSVLVLGEVFHPTAHLYRSGKHMKFYVASSGGITRYGDRRRVLVVRADGSVRQAKIGWLRSGLSVHAGDVVVVPKKLETYSALRMATDITQILYQLAVSTAAAKAVGVF